MTQTTGKSKSSSKGPDLTEMRISKGADNSFIATHHYAPSISRMDAGSVPPPKQHPFHSAEALAAHTHQAFGGKGTVHSSARGAGAKHPAQKMQFADHAEMAAHLHSLHGKKK